MVLVGQQNKLLENSHSKMAAIKKNEELDGDDDSEYDDDHSGDDDTDDENIPDAKDISFTSKETYYYRMIDKYYKGLEEANITKMIDIVNGSSKISLRLLDWFVTRYSDLKNVSYEVDGDYFSVHVGYKAQLKSYKKKYFDPFRRRKKFRYTYANTATKKQLNTTIGQLNFFKWIFSYQILSYVESNYKKLIEEMVSINKKEKQIKNKKKNTKDNKDTSTTQKAVVNKEGVTIKATVKKDPKKETIVISFD